MVNRKRHIVELLVAVCIIVLLNFIASFFFYRLDLTKEKRYTVSSETRSTLRTLPDIVYIRVYLDGDLPVGFNRLKNGIRELLDEFRAYAPRNLQYEFIDPAAETDPGIRRSVFTGLYELGLQPTNAQVRTRDGSMTQKVIFPGAVIVYRNTEVAINLLKNNPGLPGEINLQNSIESLEYEFISMIGTLSSDTVRKVAFIEGHGELDAYQVGDITKELANFYQVDRGAIRGRYGSLDPYEAVIIAHPMEEFDEADKFVLDQYLMNGGKLLWLIDPVRVSMDSLYRGSTVAWYQPLNLDDQLFRYGVRLNPYLAKDIQCHVIPVNVGLAGGQADWQLRPWYYFPLISPPPGHMLTRALNMIMVEFGSVIDTVGGDPAVKKTVLLSTSPYSRKVAVPVQVSLAETGVSPDEASFNESGLPLAVLLEGRFESVFANRAVPGEVSGQTSGIRERSEATRMIVVADGDMIRNAVTETADGPRPEPLGFDRYTSQTFGNKQFLLNAVNYLCDQTGLMNLRGREFRLRLLDRKRIVDEANFWKVINTLLPVLIVLIFGVLMHFRRRQIHGR